MAEVAIPLIALGSLYISSNKKCEKESFQVEGNTRQQRNQTQVSGTVNNNQNTENFDNYINPNDQRTKYYDKNAVVEIGKTQQTKPTKHEFMSLTGETVSAEKFKHNNMQPFFGSKVRGKNTNGRP